MIGVEQLVNLLSFGYSEFPLRTRKYIHDRNLTPKYSLLPVYVHACRGQRPLSSMCHHGDAWRMACLELRNGHQKSKPMLDRDTASEASVSDVYLFSYAGYPRTGRFHDRLPPRPLFPRATPTLPLYRYRMHEIRHPEMGVVLV